MADATTHSYSPGQPISTSSSGNILSNPWKNVELDTDLIEMIKKINDTLDINTKAIKALHLVIVGYRDRVEQLEDRIEDMEDKNGNRN